MAPSDACLKDETCRREKQYGPAKATHEHTAFGVWVINLKGSTDRLATLETDMIEKNGLSNVHRVAAVDTHPQLFDTDGDLFSSLGFDTPLSSISGGERRGAVGLDLSNILAWREIIQDKDHWWHIILEDDARVVPKVGHFKSAVAALTHELDVHAIRAEATRTSNFRTLHVDKMCSDGTLSFDTICSGSGSGSTPPTGWGDPKFARPCENPSDVDCTVGSSVPMVVW